jgi:hypothetical protein
MLLRVESISPLVGMIIKLSSAYWTTGKSIPKEVSSGTLMTTQASLMMYYSN